MARLKRILFNYQMMMSSFSENEINLHIRENGYEKN